MHRTLKMKITRIKAFIVWIIIALNYSCMPACKISTKIQEQSLTELRTILQKNEQWVKVHAAEYLIWLNKDLPEVRKVYLAEYQQYHNEPKYRIGISRILYQASADAGEKEKWLGKVLAVFGDTTSPDRIHAAETLAKLKTSPEKMFPAATQASLSDTSRILQTYTRWATSFTSEEVAKKNKAQFIELAFTDDDIIIRKISAYVLLKSKSFSTNEWIQFATKAINEAPGEIRNNLLNAAFATYKSGDDALSTKVKVEMLQNWKQFSATQRIELAQALAENGNCEDANILTVFLNNGENNNIYDAQSPTGADVRAAAAYALLRIAARNN